MTSSGQKLHTLIKSLSSKERQFLLRSFASRGRRKSERYKLLFRLVDSLDSFEEEALDQLLAEHQFPSHKGVLKIQLFNWVLRQMHGYHHHVQPNEWTQVRTVLWQARFLQKKGLAPESRKKLDQVDQLLSHQDVSASHLLYLEEELTCQRDPAFRHQEPSPIGLDWKAILDQVELKLESKRVTTRLMALSFDWKDKHLEAELAQILDLPAFKVPVADLPPGLHGHAYQNQGYMTLLRGRKLEAAGFFRVGLTCLEANLPHAYEARAMYVELLLESILSDPGHRERPFLDDQLKVLSATVFPLSERKGELVLRDQSLILLGYLQSVALIHYGEVPPRGANGLELLEEGSPKMEILRPEYEQLRAEARLNLAMWMLGTGKLIEAQKLSQLILKADPEQKFRPIFASTLLISMILHFELGEMDFFQHYYLMFSALSPPPSDAPLPPQLQIPQILLELLKQTDLVASQKIMENALETASSISLHPSTPHLLHLPGWKMWLQRQIEVVISLINAEI